MATDRPCPALGVPVPPARLQDGFWAQVKVLELEKRLEGERVRLGELRKQHYGLAGGCEDAPEDGEARPAPAPRRGILKKPPIAQKPGLGEVSRAGGRAGGAGGAPGTGSHCLGLCAPLVAAVAAPGPSLLPRCLRAAVPSSAPGLETIPHWIFS